LRRGPLLLGSLGCGYVLVGLWAVTSRSLALGRAQRDISAGLHVAVENFPDPDVVSRPVTPLPACSFYPATSHTNKGGEGEVGVVADVDAGQGSRPHYYYKDDYGRIIIRRPEIYESPAPALF